MTTITTTLGDYCDTTSADITTIPGAPSADAAVTLERAGDNRWTAALDGVAMGPAYDVDDETAADLREPDASTITAAQINALLPVQRSGVNDSFWPFIRKDDDRWSVNDYTGMADDETYDSEAEAVDAAIDWAMATHPDLDQDECERIYRECDRSAAFDQVVECGVPDSVRE